MRNTYAVFRRWSALTCGLCLLLPGTRILADEPATTPAAKSEDEVAATSLYDALRQGDVSVKAEGIGDGRMTLSLTNKTKRHLRVVLPPGLIASGVTGQFGGMGGMGGGMGGMGGGMGGMGGGMGGMGGGMGGMGGGMGGMGGGMGGGGMGGGGMGGGMGGGGMQQGGGTLPASMGMMMLGQLIMSLIGDRDSWDPSSLMSGMMGGMGGMGGGMGGGMMGGMGGGMRGGGMRSVPPTGLPLANLKAGQTRHLPTRLVALSDNDPTRPGAMPAKGEALAIGDIAQLPGADARVQKALRRLAADKAPSSVSQLVMWRVAARRDWDAIARDSKGWANAHELTLARAFVDSLDALPEGESGSLLVAVAAADAAQATLADELAKLLDGQTVLGLPVKLGIPATPVGPAVACRVQVIGTAERPEAQVQVAKSDGNATTWVPVGKFTLGVERSDGKVKGGAFADALAGEVLGRLVRAQLSKGPLVKGKQTYKIRVDNASPLLLNGVAVQGSLGTAEDLPKVLSGISLSPFKNMTVPATGEMVEQLGLKKGIRVIAADLSGL